MKIYRLSLKNDLAKHSISIDPGVNSSGLCFLNFLTRELITQTYIEKNPTRTVYPIIFQSSGFMLNNYLSFVKEFNIDLTQTELNIEYSFTQGSFSPGLLTEITHTIDTFIYLGINKVNFLPAKVTGHFLQCNSKISEKMIKAWFKEFLPNIATDSPHSRDALMLSMFMNFDYYLHMYPTLEDVRRPVIEFIDLKNRNILNN